MLLITLVFINKVKLLATSLKIDLLPQQQMIVLVTPDTALCLSEREPLQRTFVKLKQGRPRVGDELLFEKHCN